MVKIFAFLAVLVAQIFAKPLAVSSVLPTEYFVKEIAGDFLEIKSMVQKGDDPHTYEPKPKQMQEIQKCDLYFSIGSEFDEIWVPKFKKQNPQLEIIETDFGIKKNSDGNEDDPHIWLDPVLVKIQAQNILNALIKKFPQNEAKFSENYQNLIKKVDEINEYAINKFKGLEGRKFVVYHPAFGYFANRYNLVQLSIEVEGKEPKPSFLADLIKEMRSENIKTIFASYKPKDLIIFAKQSDSKIEIIDQMPLDWSLEMKNTIDLISKSFQ